MTPRFEGTLKIHEDLMSQKRTINTMEDVEEFFEHGEIVEIVARYVQIRVDQTKSRKKAYLKQRELIKLAKKMGLDKEMVEAEEEEEA